MIWLLQKKQVSELLLMFIHLRESDHTVKFRLRGRRGARKLKQIDFSQLRPAGFQKEQRQKNRHKKEI